MQLNTDCSDSNSSAGDASDASLAVHIHGRQSRISVCLSVISNQEHHPVVEREPMRTRKCMCTCCHWKAEFKSFPTVCNTPILLIIGMSYNVRKLLTSAFSVLALRKRWSKNGASEELFWKTAPFCKHPLEKIAKMACFK